MFLLLMLLLLGAKNMNVCLSVTLKSLAMIFGLEFEVLILGLKGSNLVTLTKFWYRDLKLSHLVSKLGTRV